MNCSSLGPIKNDFIDQLISCFGSVDCLSSLCNLTSLDYFLWCYMKSVVYTDKPVLISGLKGNIERVKNLKKLLKMIPFNWTT